MNKLHRTDDASAGNKFIQNYTYANSWLSSVGWKDGNTAPLVTKFNNYDPNGNLILDERNNDNQIAYNLLSNLPKSMIDPAGSNNLKTYRYNAQNQRLVKTISNAGTVLDIEYYLEEVILDEFGNVKSYQTSIGHAQPINSSTIEYYYNVKDWLGTNRVVLDETGSVANATDHYPYGKRMPGRFSVANNEGGRYQFTGHEYDDETTYEYHGARYYNRVLGRYMSIDPLAVQFPSHSAYNYVMGNPNMFVDPDGKAAEDWVQRTDGSIYWDQNAKDQASTQKGEKYLSSSYFNIAVVDAIGDHIMRSDDAEAGHKLFLEYVKRFGTDYFNMSARHNYETNASGIMETMTNKSQSVKDGIRVSQMTHSWVDAAGWTANRNQLEHWIGMFTIADNHGMAAASLIGWGNESRGLLINDYQSGNMRNAVEGKSANNGGATAFEWQDIKYNRQGLDKWAKLRGEWNVDLNRDGKVTYEEFEKYKESKGGLGE